MANKFYVIQQVKRLAANTQQATENSAPDYKKSTSTDRSAPGSQSKPSQKKDYLFAEQFFQGIT